MTRPPRALGSVAQGDCTRSVAAPVIDGVVSLGHLGQAAGIWGESRASFDTDEDYDRNRIGSAIIAGAFAVSAVHGFKWSSECRRRAALSEQAIRDHLRAVSGLSQGQSHPNAPPVRRP
ncbi:MAG: hypothetical protein F4164_06955 [Gemmatimonadales bacterium]|nr:hypothetical protein [Gemmatimonadales bacterium]MYG49097.1 hypothetical protein [Gemmatimonadales bacterium]MYK02010.1 hypothetical protein [Candidatus Palauibacter ramosifaciens]